MKIISIIAAAALGSAFVLPDVNVFQQLAAKKEQSALLDWWNDHAPSGNSVASSFRDTVDELSGEIDHALSSIGEGLLDEFNTITEDEDWSGDLDDGDEPGDKPRHPRRPHHPRRPPHGRPPHGRPPHTSNLTIYELISKSKFTTNFTKVLNEYDDIVQLLNSTDKNYTLYVPIDSAIREPPEGKKPSKEFIESALLYHIGLGTQPTPHFFSTHTVATALNEEYLGGNPQRLRTSFRRVNFYSKIVAANIPAKNGIIHAVNRVLIPPPMVGKELSLLPSTFSTLLLAYTKTDFVKFIHAQPMNGTTVFAPTNAAFAALGPAANAFLFNTETGLRYLAALLKYQIVANTTVYSDAIYTHPEGDGAGDGRPSPPGKTILGLPTLLDGKKIFVRIVHGPLGGFVRMRVNGRVPVVVMDGVARNGVIQVVGRVPVPPRKGKKEEEDQPSGELGVEELKERLDSYVEDGGSDGAQEPIDEL